MKIGLALRELHRAETALARELLRLSDRHHAEHEIHHVARDLARWSQRHVAGLAEAARRYDVHLRATSPHSSGVLAPVRTTFSDLTRGRDEPGLLLLADLRRLHRRIAGVSLDWELLAQGAQAVKDGELLELTADCHPRTLRQLTWSNAMLKTLSPQVLAS
jgi:aryl-alcohol dehydrogenase-like predicted oxidoreductase